MSIWKRDVGAKFQKHFYVFYVYSHMRVSLTKDGLVTQIVEALSIMNYDKLFIYWQLKLGRQSKDYSPLHSVFACKSAIFGLTVKKYRNLAGELGYVRLCTIKVPIKTVEKFYLTVFEK